MKEKVNESSIFGRYIKSLPLEEQEELAKTIKLMEDNTFFETKIISQFEDNEGNIKSKATREVKVYKRILRNSTVEDRLLITFGGYSEYALDKHFIVSMRERLQEHHDAKFRIDMGRNENICRTIMLPLLEEIEEALNVRGVVLEEDYSKEFRNSEMGRMISSLGMSI